MWVQMRETVKLKEFEKHGNALNGLVVYLRKEEEGKEERNGEKDKEKPPEEQEKNA
jgi:hypothetical protein